MQAIRLGNKVVSITVLQQNSAGDVTPVVLFERKQGKARSTPVLGTIERIIEQMMDAEIEFMDSYRRRFKDSSRKKRDGWLIDIGPNVFRAARDGMKKIRIERLV
jgi:hypothetical protein